VTGPGWPGIAGATPVRAQIALGMTLSATVSGSNPAQGLYYYRLSFHLLLPVTVTVARDVTATPRLRDVQATFCLTCRASSRKGIHHCSNEVHT